MSVKDILEEQKRSKQALNAKIIEEYGVDAYDESKLSQDDEKFNINDIVEGISNTCTLYHDEDMGIPFIIHKNKCKDFEDEINSIIAVYVYDNYRSGVRYKQDIKDILYARAEDRRIKTYIRTAHVSNKCYYKLNTREMIEITEDGWVKVPHGKNVIFRPSDLATGQIDPIGGGNLYKLLDNIQISKEEKILLIGALVSAMMEDVNHPILNITGAHGSGKSTISNYIKSIIDPNGSSGAGGMSNEKDMILALSNNICYIFDNLSHLTQGQSDILARAATGGGMDMRTLYKTSKMQRVVFNLTVIINSITDTFTQSDILDRTIKIELQPLTKWAGSDILKDTPKIAQVVGAIFDNLVYVLKNRDKYTGEPSPVRMSDYYYITLLVGEYNNFTKEEVDNAFTLNTNKTLEQSIASSTIGEWILENITPDKPFHGTTSELFDLINSPLYKKPQSLGSALSKIKPNLSKIGFLITDKNSKTKKYEIVALGDLDLNDPIVKEIKSSQKSDKTEGFELSGW